ncbi:hypothetical protein Hypma_000290 [Hypsizygus marmoreus]|uniref:Uncharacterized protein n=1 Tax=Hypsizygus marmoreus TaxID=39966 RepID=A0A369JFJ3_HYPMA|nr:hypothetical protein Hypma_000290 [Hypsizygus marmoreus]
MAIHILYFQHSADLHYCADTFDPSKIDTLEPKLTTRKTPAISHAPLLLPLQQPAKVSSSNEACRPIVNPLKRTFLRVHEDDSYTEIQSQPAKKRRIQESIAPSVFDSDQQVRSFSKEKKHEDKNLNLNVASLSPRNTKTVDLDSLATNSALNGPLQSSSQDALAFPNQNHIPLVSGHSSLRGLFSEPERLVDRSQQASRPSIQNPFIKLSKTTRPFKRRSTTEFRYTPLEITGRDNANIQAPRSSLSNISTNTIESAHTAFWTKTRHSYSGSGPLILSMVDVVEARAPPCTDAKTFTRGGSYLGERFECRWL